eukprot:scaffold12703_cov101-Isochrysis_galbana.AAC.5
MPLITLGCEEHPPAALPQAALAVAVDLVRLGARPRLVRCREGGAAAFARAEEAARGGARLVEVFVNSNVIQIESPTWQKLRRHQLPAPVPQAPHHPAVDNLAPLEPVRAARVVQHRIRRLRDEVAARMPAEEAAAAASHRSTFAPRNHALEPPLPVLRGKRGHTHPCHPSPSPIAPHSHKEGQWRLPPVQSPRGGASAFSPVPHC